MTKKKKNKMRAKFVKKQHLEKLMLTKIKIKKKSSKNIPKISVPKN